MNRPTFPDVLKADGYVPRSPIDQAGHASTSASGQQVHAIEPNVKLELASTSSAGQCASEPDVKFEDDCDLDLAAELKALQVQYRNNSLSRTN